jgi:D-alanyl-lipoteichoic acid acyltransferase DltB (MBOAT superfamily)
MLFLSLPFVVFFSLFFLLYWFIFDKTLAQQNLLILVGSWFFYAWWDWRFLFLLIGQSMLTYFFAILLVKTRNERSRKVVLWAGVAQGLGMLFLFKYYPLNSLLPLGISFYTFKTISYLLDTKRGKIVRTTDWVVFFSYVSFFPCLLSGPIDRPGLFLPQLEKKRVFDYGQASDGMRQLLWGLFKKAVIADNCASFTTDIFDHYQSLPASSLLFGAFLYTVQIYADFSGYSDMAIGLSSLLGFTVTRNFNFPYFARNIADFWRRWNISLTSWVTDYVFTPLMIYFRDYGKMGAVFAILINFIAIGIWHGPHWTFVVFGFLHGCYFIPLILRGSGPSLPAFVNRAGVLLLLVFTFILFRSNSLPEALAYYQRLFSLSVFSLPPITEKVTAISTLACMVLMFTAEWLQRDKQHALQIDFIKRFPARVLIYYTLVLLILTFSASKNTDFIYFKF